MNWCRRHWHFPIPDQLESRFVHSFGRLGPGTVDRLRKPCEFAARSRGIAAATDSAPVVARRNALANDPPSFDGDSSARRDRWRCRPAARLCGNKRNPATCLSWLHVRSNYRFPFTARLGICFPSVGHYGLDFWSRPGVDKYSCGTICKLTRKR